MPGIHTEIGLIDPLIGGIEFRRGDNNNLHAAHGSVAGTWMHDNRRVLSDWNAYAIKFHTSAIVTFNNEVGFGDVLVEVGDRIR